MNEPKIFENADFGKIRVMEQNGEPWFVAADVCKALDLEDTGRATSRLDEDELTRIKIVSGGQNREVIAVNEPGLYALVLGSRKPEAKAFKRWITHDVIPSIRKHGMYATENTVEAMIADPDTAIELLKTIKAERQKRQALEDQNRQLQTDLDRSKEWYSIKRVAALNGCSFRRFDWRKLKRESVKQGYGVKKIFDANYGEVNTYHMSVWETVYPEMEL